MADALSNWNNQMKTAIDSYNSAIDSGLKASKLQADNQKQEAYKTKVKSNAAAQRSYLDTINPYGYSQQSLASAGLSRSGVGETSRISAGNTYSNALADARSDYNDTVRQSDLQYQQAVLTAAEDKGKYAADTLLSGTQWAAEYALKQRELEEQVATNKITRAQAQAELDVYKKYAMQQALADLEATRASTKATLSKL